MLWTFSYEYACGKFTSQSCRIQKWKIHWLFNFYSSLTWKEKNLTTLYHTYTQMMKNLWMRKLLFLLNDADVGVVKLPLRPSHKQLLWMKIIMNGQHTHDSFEGWLSLTHLHQTWLRKTSINWFLITQMRKIWKSCVSKHTHLQTFIKFFIVNTVWEFYEWKWRQWAQRKIKRRISALMTDECNNKFYSESLILLWMNENFRQRLKGRKIYDFRLSSAWVMLILE